MGREDSASLSRSQRRTTVDIAWAGALVGLGFPDAGVKLLGRLDGSVPWSDVVAETKRLRLAPLFHVGLHSSPVLRRAIPPSVAAHFRRAAYAAAARTMCLERACVGVVTAATNAGIRVLVLKGLALGALVYPSPMTRPMDDIDLLVAEGDRGRLTTLLHGLGYRNDLMGEEDFYPLNRAYSIDVQTGLVNTTRVPARGALWPVTFEELWSRRQAFLLDDITIQTLGSRDTMLHLAVHAAHHHGLRGALWMADLLASLRAWPLAPSDMIDAPTSVRRSLWYCLEVLAARGQDPVPEVRTAVRPCRMFPMEKRALAAISQGYTPEPVRYAFTLACLPTKRARITFLRQLFFPPADTYRKGFEAAGAGCPGLRSHWSAVLHLGGSVFRALLKARSSARRASIP